MTAAFTGLSVRGAAGVWFGLDLIKAISRNDTLIGVLLKIAAMVLQQNYEGRWAGVSRG